jgi:hypothetical protein
MWFNYANSTINVALPASANPLAMSAALLITREFVARDDLWLDGVSVRYLVSSRWTANYISSSTNPDYRSTQSSGPSEYVYASEDAGSTNGRIRLVMNINVGSNDMVETIYQWPQFTYKTLQQWANENNLRSMGQLLANAGEGTVVIESGSGWSRLAPKADTGYCRNLTLYEELSDTGLNNNDWCIEEKAAKVPEEIYSRTTYGTTWKWGRLRTAWASTINGNATYQHYSRVRLLHASTGYRPSTMRFSSNAIKIDSITSGLAAALYNSRRVTYYQGSVRMPMSYWNNHWAFTVFGVTSPVMQVTHDLFTEITDLQFGPPELLRPADIAAGFVKKSA